MTALDQLYQQRILEHNRQPVGRGRVSASSHAARGQDALCGDDLQVELRVENGRILEAAFWGEACAITLASASMLMQWLPGRSSADLQAGAARWEQLLAEPDLPDDPTLGAINCLRGVHAFPARVRNALLPWRTAVQALECPVIAGQGGG